MTAKRSRAPLRPYTAFTDADGHLTKEAYDFLFELSRHRGDPTGVTPVAVPSGGPVPTATPSNTVAIDGSGILSGQYGYTQAQAQAIITKLNAVIDALVANGIME